jgi:hypothetical protein
MSASTLRVEWFDSHLIPLTCPPAISCGVASALKTQAEAVVTPAMMQDR